MTISASMVRELREKTSAGMLDCKKALEETKGDFEAAVEWLRKKGLASAAKKADRLASEGMVSAFVKNGKTAALLEVNSETDFVAKNDNFIVIRDSVFVNNDSYRFYVPGGYPPVRLNIYPQASLKIKLQRSQTDNFESFSIQHSAVNENNIVSDYYVFSPKEVTDRNVKELTVPTVAGVFTKIISTKRINSTQIITNIDSVRCTKGGTNTFTVVF